MTYVQEMHIARSSCLLCRQDPSDGSRILDLHQNLLTASMCKLPCTACIRSPYPSVWFHAACYEILGDSYEPSKKPSFEDLGRLADAVSPIYKPRLKEYDESAAALEGLFSRHAKNVIQDSFRRDLFEKLPAEILTMISEFLAPCWYLIVIGETRRLIEDLRRSSGTQSTRLSLTREIWMSRIEYRGVSYVARLSSKSLKSVGACNQYHIKLPRNIKKIVLSLDYIGLRGIQFTDHDSDLAADGSPWYKIIEARDSHVEADVSFDGLFLRDIQLISDTSCSPCRRIWSSPFPPKFLHGNSFRSLNRHSRLDYIKLDTQIQGLLACCSNGLNVGVHGFSDRTKEFTKFVDLMHRRASGSTKFWIYFPLNEREYIKGAWIRKFKDIISKPILILQTSLERTITFGSQIPSCMEEHVEYHSLINKDDGVLSGIFHDGLDPGLECISEVGVTCTGDRQGHPKIQEQPPLLNPNYEPPELPPARGSPTRAWYMTKAPLNGLVRVQVCRDSKQPHRPCLGFLLFYNDHRIEALGQVCWGRGLTEEILAPMYVQKGTTACGKDYVKDIQSETYGSRIGLGDEGWQGLPQCGTIVWWFGHIGDRIVTYSD